MKHLPNIVIMKKCDIVLLIIAHTFSLMREDV